MANLEEDFYGTFSKKGKLLFGLERAVNVHFSELCFFTLNFINLSTLMEGMEDQSSKLLHFSFFSLLSANAIKSTIVCTAKGFCGSQTLSKNRSLKETLMSHHFVTHHMDMVFYFIFYLRQSWICPSKIMY